jgi:hypothetical protein
MIEFILDAAKWVVLGIITAVIAVVVCEVLLYLMEKE